MYIYVFVVYVYTYQHVHKYKKLKLTKLSNSTIHTSIMLYILQQEKKNFKACTNKTKEKRLSAKNKTEYKIIIRVLNKII